MFLSTILNIIKYVKYSKDVEYFNKSKFLIY